MIKSAIFRSGWLPYALLAPQVAVLAVFFFWPAVQALGQAFFVSDAFGGNARFVGFDNFTRLLSSREYRQSFGVTFVFSGLTAGLSMGMGLVFALLANRAVNAATTIRSLLIWPYAVAPAVAGALWMFVFNPTMGVLAHALNRFIAMGWDPTLNAGHAMTLLVLAAAWKQVSYNFVFFLAGLQAIPQSVVEAAAIDGAGPVRRCFAIVLPLLSPTSFFLAVMNVVYAFFDTFGIVHTTTAGRPAGSTRILVYKIYQDGFVGLDLGSSAAQSVLLMAVVILLTVLQFRHIERRVRYAA